ncbi:DUF1707 domain-containing protein [Nocardiopsis sp. NRRL B-16309]|uniref:DUF1707 SHOCT-like domain-containing protein n=1 Tax=Nocardiopsis sp. NRRL B-16309 TaxID=1519494 RepID=UPI0006B01917|nr:DUF1707 domain-containing protein [Nocardiopsis sp. NRRL B-16309]KOX18330.1 hypothetical protein ADL05_07790 [Nocardiopsis sp. NRRL B-16309]
MAGPGPDHSYRLSDDERDEALAHLRTALSEGRLDFDEHGARSDAVMHAVTNTELVPLFEDLPPRLRPAAITGPEAAGAAPAVPGARGESPARRSAGDGRPDRSGHGVNVGGLVAWGGFLFFVWGLPTLVSGNVTGFLVFLGFFCMLVVGPGVGQHLKHRRRLDRGGRDRRGEIEGG